MERLKVFDDLKKLLCKACKVIFLVFEVEVLPKFTVGKCYENLLGVMMF